MRRNLYRSFLKKPRTIHPRSGLFQLSALDMLTCCLGAMLLFWLISASSIKRAKGVASAQLLTFRAEPPNADIGVRVRTEKGLIWAGQTSDPSITILPSTEGAPVVIVTLTGDYAKGDNLHVFLNSFETGEAKNAKVVCEFKGSSTTIQFDSTVLAYQLSLDGIREKKSITRNDWNTTNE